MRYIVARTDEVGPGERKIVTVADRSIGIFNIGGEWFALRNHCPHQGGALCTGPLWGLVEADEPGEFRYDPDRRVIACPWHGWEFDVKTGRSICEPIRLRTRSYDVKVAEGRTLTAGPDGEPIAPRYDEDRPVVYVETFHLEAEGEYLVLDTGVRNPSTPAPNPDRATPRLA
jgi:3-phenylpropionate/trans-cinnamate dioxygenase ferredoxin subunit